MPLRRSGYFAVSFALNLAAAFRAPRPFFRIPNDRFVYDRRPAIAQTSSVSMSAATSEPYVQLHPPPAKVGDALSQVDTPALCVSLDVLEANCDALAKLMEPHAGKVAVRPHAKACKSGELASMVLRRIKQANPDLDCTGVCCQKLTEAEAVLHGGVCDILITNQIVGERKIKRLIDLAQAAHAKAPSAASVAVLVDDVSNLKAIAAAAEAAKTKIKVLVEIDAGQSRCGLPAPLDTDSTEPLRALVASAFASPGVEFAGIHCYQGMLQHVRTPEERRDKVNQQVVKAAQAAIGVLREAKMWKEGLTVTGGGTGTLLYESESEVFTEVQPGSFMFMDADYNLNQWPGPVPPFRSSLHVLSQVVSRTPPPRSRDNGGRAVLDAGSKAIDYGSAPPLVVASPSASVEGEGLRCRNGGDEHSVIDLATAELGQDATGADKFPVGRAVWLVPGHCDPTVNMHDFFVCHRDAKVEAVIPILGRGPGS